MKNKYKINPRCSWLLRATGRMAKDGVVTTKALLNAYSRLGILRMIRGGQLLELAELVESIEEVDIKVKRRGRPPKQKYTVSLKNKKDDVEEDAVVEEKEGGEEEEEDQDE